MHIYQAMAAFCVEYRILPDQITEEVSGRAKGADTWGEMWATRLNIPIKPFDADWDLHGKAAGIIRNQEMLEYLLSVQTDEHKVYVVAVWDGVSRGTQDMMTRSQKAGVPVYVHTYRQHT